MGQPQDDLFFSSPMVKLTIGGSKSRLEFDALVDTGFTGFILLPIALAIPLGLELDGLNDSVTADGTRHQWPTATATIDFGLQTKGGFYRPRLRR
jgi:predicted aspartyl protease